MASRAREPVWAIECTGCAARWPLIGSGWRGYPQGDGRATAMTEPDWLTTEDVATMLAFLNGKVSERKLRLFAVACCWAVADRLPDEPYLRAVETAEMFAEGRMSRQE